MDLFHGNGGVDTPVPRGVAAAWNWLKAQTGNTHPGACSPFGMVSACAYSGAYPTGYGMYAPSYAGDAGKLFGRNTATGFTHFHHSGVGFIEKFYNFFRVVPATTRLAEAIVGRWDLEDETATPGYFAARLGGTGIKAELTVHGKVAYHRYSFPTNGSNSIIIDVGSVGLIPEKCLERASKMSVHVLNDSTVAAHIVVDGFPFHAVIQCPGKVSIWRDQAELSECRELELKDDEVGAAGVRIELEEASRQAEVRLGFSFRSVEQAKANLAAYEGMDFDAVAARTREAWASVLDRIQIRTEDETVRSVFCSSLYHALLKPVDAANESPWWEGNTPFFSDFCTMWDQYKTALPLIATICPEAAAGIAATMQKAMDVHGQFPTAYFMSADFRKCSQQAAALAHHSLFDFWVRGIEGDWKRTVESMEKAFAAQGGAEFIEKGFVKPATHTLDLANAAFATATMASALGRKDIADRMLPLSHNWKNVYDPDTGRLTTDSEYYEGTNWNYSFRPLAHMQDRIGLCGSRERFVEDLDQFFGFHDIANGKVNPEPDQATWRREIRKDIFEGLNNESDMETPYAYVFGGRHDRTAEVVRAVMKYQFTTGEGGLPGNDDSGGLTSWYVWNAMGLFPISGQDLLLMGSPIVDEARIQSGQNEFIIRVDGQSDDRIHVNRVTLNGKDIDRIWLRTGELQKGGELTLEMGEKPVSWSPPPQNSVRNES